MDSPVAAAWLREGARGRRYDETPDGGTLGAVDVKDACFGPGETDDIARADALCRRLGIPCRALDCSAEYEKIVLEYFRSEYLSGHTPNPCVRCNVFMKSGLSIGAKKTVKTPGSRMDIAKDKFLAIRVLTRFWLLQEPPEDQVFNVQYFCGNAYARFLNFYAKWHGEFFWL